MNRVSIVVVVVVFVNTTLFSTMNSTNDNKGLKSAFHFFVGINFVVVVVLFIVIFKMIICLVVVVLFIVGINLLLCCFS